MMYHRIFTKPDGRKLNLFSLRPIAEDIQATNPNHADKKKQSHLRWHPMREEWVAFASHRQDRTFLPPAEYSPLAVTKSADFPTELPAGDYDVAVFENLFPSLSPLADSAPELFVPTRPGNGACEVVVFSQDPTTSLARMTIEQIELVLEVLGNRTQEIGARPDVQYVLPFENRGVEVGVTLHHPHGQIYAYPFVPPIPQRMMDAQLDYYAKNKSSLLSDLIKNEERDRTRLITQNGSALAFIPVFARYPYETWLAPRRQVAFLHELTAIERRDYATALKTVLMKFDQLWSKPFPYLLALFQAPTDGSAHPEFHMHIEIYPAYRTRDKLKYLAGTEIAAGMFVNDSLPEEKAAELRAVEVML